jgi:hypothetical protein
MLSYTGPVYAEIGIEQHEKNDGDELQHYALNNNEVEVGELPNGKIKIFVDRDHSTTAVIDKQDCDVLKKRDNSIGLGFKFGGLMWGFGPEIKVGHSVGVEWKGDVQRMVAEYQELCSRFNTGRVSQEEYHQEKGGIIKRGYNYAKELEQRFKQKKDDMFKEMDNGNYISLENGRFENGCCFILPKKIERNMLVATSPFRKMIPTDCRDMGVCNRSRNFDSVLPDKYYGTTFEQRTIIDAMEHAQRMNRIRGYRGNSNGNWNIRIGGGW